MYSENCFNGKFYFLCMYILENAQVDTFYVLNLNINQSIFSFYNEMKTQEVFSDVENLWLDRL